MAETPTGPRERRRRLEYLFFVCGPPIGAIVPGINLASGFGYDIPPLTPSERLFDQLKVLGVILILSYVVGGLPAWLTGIGGAHLAKRDGTASFWNLLIVASLATTLTVLGFYLSFAILDWFLPAGEPVMNWEGALRLLIASPFATIPATVACWAIARRRRLL